MAKMTIAQLREKELDKLVRFKTESPTEDDYAEAIRMMNSFYRLCGLSERNLYMQNDVRMHDTKWAEECEKREDKWWQRLDSEFNRVYGLRLVYCGYAPSIGVVGKEGGFHERIYRWFYDR